MVRSVGARAYVPPHPEATAPVRQDPATISPESAAESPSLASQGPQGTSIGAEKVTINGEALAADSTSQTAPADSNPAVTNVEQARASGADRSGSLIIHPPGGTSTLSVFA